MTWTATTCSKSWNCPPWICGILAAESLSQPTKTTKGNWIGRILSRARTAELSSFREGRSETRLVLPRCGLVRGEALALLTILAQQQDRQDRCLGKWKVHRCNRFCLGCQLEALGRIWLKDDRMR